MSDAQSLWPLLVAAIVAAVAAGAFGVWRLAPVVRGRVRAADDAETRLRRWNDHLVPFLTRRLGQRTRIAPAEVFQSAADGQAHTVATWRLERTVLPDVEFVALARPGNGGTDVVAVAEAPALRALLGLDAHRQDLWGHVVYLYHWPPDVDLQALVGRLVPLDVFRARHGFCPGAAGGKGS